MWWPATLEFFHKQPHGKYGLRAQCKSCQAAYVRNNREANKKRRIRYYKKNRDILKARREANKQQKNEQARQHYADNHEAFLARRRAHREQNREAIAQYQRRYQQENRERLSEEDRKRYRENRESLLEKKKRYYQDNREAVLAATRRWGAQNRESKAEYNRRWHKANPEYGRIARRRRRALVRNAEHEPYGDVDIHNLWQRQGGCCYYCDTSLFGVYHIEHKIPLIRGGADKLENIALACPPCNLQKGTMTAEEFTERRNSLSA